MNYRVDELVREIAAHDFACCFVVYCEGPRTPGLLGQIRGVTDWDERVVRVSTAANATPEALVETLEHELHHVEDPDWDCGNRDVLARGGPKP